MGKVRINQGRERGNGGDRIGGEGAMGSKGGTEGVWEGGYTRQCMTNRVWKKGKERGERRESVIRL